MIFLLDENFPRAAAAHLETAGHSVHYLRDTIVAGSEDTKVMETAQRLGALILTTDRDFFHTLHRENPGHAGVVVIALRKPSRAAILDRLRWFLENVPASAWAGRAFQLRDRTWLARPPMQTIEDTGEPDSPTCPE